MFDNYKDIQNVIYSMIINSAKNNKISHAYLIDSNEYNDIDNFVLSFVKLLICPYHYSNYDKCDGCNKCSRIDNNNYTEVRYIKPDGISIKKEQLKESYIFNFQKQIIDNIQWSENELENKKIILLMLFKLIYDRAQMSLDEELLYLKNRYAKSSSKHVAIVVKDLERRNKEDFGEVKDDNKQKAITFNQFNNFTHYSIEHDKAHGILKQNPTNLLPDNDEDIIDAEYE